MKPIEGCTVKWLGAFKNGPLGKLALILVDSTLFEHRVTFFNKWANLRPLFHFFVFSNTHYKFLQQLGIWKNVHPVHSAKIRTHDFWNMSLLP